MIADISLTEEEKFIEIAFMCKQFFALHADIKAILAFETISDFGFVANLIDVAVDVSPLRNPSLEMD